MNAKRFTQISLLIAALVLSCRSKTDVESLPWSVRMADSVMARNRMPWQIDFRSIPRWEYTQGLVLKAIWQVGERTGDEKYLRYVENYYDAFIDESGQIGRYKLEEYNIDRINPGKVLFALHRRTGKEKYKKALFLLRSQMQTHPRTSEGGFWHKKVYPHQMWVDGLYMASPFLAEFAHTFAEPALFDDVARQFLLMEKHARDDSTGLLYHGWDESRQQRWADPQTGLSPHFWGRGMGWFSMALVDVLDWMPNDHPQTPELVAMLNRLAAAISRVQDPQTGLWYQILDQGNQPGNYLESSASCMFAYSLCKGVQKGYLPQDYLVVAQRAYEGVLARFIRTDSLNTISITDACSVAGLGGDPYRDGSFAYYIGEPRRDNDPKAVGPFILASLQFESLTE